MRSCNSRIDPSETYAPPITRNLGYLSNILLGYLNGFHVFKGKETELTLMFQVDHH